MKAEEEAKRDIAGGAVGVRGHEVSDPGVFARL